MRVKNQLTDMLQILDELVVFCIMAISLITVFHETKPGASYFPLCVNMQGCQIEQNIQHLLLVYLLGRNTTRMTAVLLVGNLLH